MELEVKLDAFEGPLDLLLQLIEKNRVSICDIPIASIADQYAACVEAMDHEDLDLTSDFLVMAATLLDIKARMLLPKEKTEGEEEDPREALAEQLREYRKYRALSQELEERENLTGPRWFRGENLPAQVREYRPPVDWKTLLGDLTAEDLRALFVEAMRRRPDREQEEPQTETIPPQPVPMPERMERVRELAAGGRTRSFAQLLPQRATKQEVVVTFLAVLELVRTGEIRLVDAGTDEIVIKGEESHADERAD